MRVCVLYVCGAEGVVWLLMGRYVGRRETISCLSGCSACRHTAAEAAAQSRPPTSLPWESSHEHPLRSGPGGALPVGMARYLSQSAPFSFFFFSFYRFPFLLSPFFSPTRRRLLLFLSRDSSRSRVTAPLPSRFLPPQSLPDACYLLHTAPHHPPQNSTAPQPEHPITYNPPPSKK